MDKSVVTVKGQVVIPSELRQKFGIRKGTQVYLYERHGEIIIKPITDEYIQKMAGMADTKGKLLKALMQGKAMEREGEEGRQPQSLTTKSAEDRKTIANGA
ncbi:MAG: AbrB/MazE/SpoVT family DNA-binding domain-containing protein [Candidatus Binatia bacterium]